MIRSEFCTSYRDGWMDLYLPFQIMMIVSKSCDRASHWTFDQASVSDDLHNRDINSIVILFKKFIYGWEVAYLQWKISVIKGEKKKKIWANFLFTQFFFSNVLNWFLFLISMLLPHHLIVWWQTSCFLLRALGCN